MRKSRFRDDQKRFKLVMTEEGTNLMKEVMPFIKDLRKASTLGITEEEFEIFYKVLDQLWENFDLYEGRS